MRFSVAQAVSSPSKHFTELMIYGKKGADARSRLALWRGLKDKGLTEQQLKDTFVRLLPLDFGRKFSRLANILTVLLGLVFIVFATDSARDFVLQIHRVTDGFIDYVLLAIQWWSFYLIASAVGSCLASLVALWVYARRISNAP